MENHKKKGRYEVVIPFFNKDGNLWGVLDIDSKDLNSFDETDAESLEKILGLLRQNKI